MRDKSAMICFAVIVLYALVSIGGVVYNIIAERSEDIPTFAEMADPSKSDQPPSLESWKTVLGTDWYGKPIIIK